jgi:hypothetical protein
MRDDTGTDEPRRWWAPSVVVSGVIVVLVAVVLLVGQRVVPHVVGFNLQGASVSPDVTVQLKLEFSRPMDHKATEEAFSITPGLTGNFSWSQRTLVYTSTRKPDPGTRYTVRVGESEDTLGRKSKGFSGTFETTGESDGG